MKRIAFSLLALCAVFGCTGGEPPKSEVGDHARPYSSTKCGGVDDGVAEGKTICYTCRAGDAPMYCLFIRNQQPSPGALHVMKEVDSLVAAGKKEKVTGVINFLGDPEDEATREGLKKLAQQHKLTHVAVTVTEEGDKFNLNDKDEVTVIVHEEGIIRLRIDAETSELDQQAAEVVRRCSKALANF